MPDISTGWQSLPQDVVEVIRTDFAALRTTVNSESGMSGYVIPAISSDGYEVKCADGRHLPQSSFFVNVRTAPRQETMGLASGASRTRFDVRCVVGVRNQSFGTSGAYTDTAAWPEDAGHQILMATARVVLNVLVAGLPAKTGVTNVISRGGTLVSPDTKFPNLHRLELALDVDVFTQNAWS